jgi:hypothetical protein
MRLTWQTQASTPLTPPYCKSIPCTCGRNCHDDPALHGRETGAPTSDEYYNDGIISSFPQTEWSDEQYEYALALLGVR